MKNDKLFILRTCHDHHINNQSDRQSHHFFEKCNVLQDSEHRSELIKSNISKYMRDH